MLCRTSQWSTVLMTSCQTDQISKKVKCIGGSGKTHAVQKGMTPTDIKGRHDSEVMRNPVVWSTRSKGIGKVLSYTLAITEKTAKRLPGLSGSILKNTASTYLSGDTKGCQF